MKAIGNWILAFLGKCAQVVFRLFLFILGSIIKVLGKAVEKLGEEIILLGK